MTEIEIDSDPTRVSDGYHPSYSSPSADIVLLSDDGVKFRVHSAILATASKFFHDMFGMPRSAAENHDDALPMSESSEILKTLLDIIYPCDTDPVLPSLSFAFLRRLLSAAEKYDLARVNHYVRLLTRTELFLSRPLEAYALAGTFGWDEDVHRRSLQTLNLDLSSPTYAEILKCMDSASLCRLLRMRWKIKEKALWVVKQLKEYKLELMWGCDCSGNTPAEEDWDCLEMVIRGELDKCPDGSSLRQPGLWSNAEEVRLWNLSCDLCSKRLVQKSTVQRAINKALEIDFTQC